MIQCSTIWESAKHLISDRRHPEMTGVVFQIEIERFAVIRSKTREQPERGRFLLRKPLLPRCKAMGSTFRKWRLGLRLLCSKRPI